MRAEGTRTLPTATEEVKIEILEEEKLLSGVPSARLLTDAHATDTSEGVMSKLVPYCSQKNGTRESTTCDCAPVLIVDDNHINIMALRLLLSTICKLKSDQALDGVAAVEACRL